MFIHTKYVRFLEENLADALEGAREKLWVKLLKISKKISAVSVAGKMVTFAIFFAVLPVGTVPVKDQSYQLAAKFEPKAGSMFTETNPTTSVEVGESNFDKTEREKAIQLAKAEAKTVEAVEHRDPSDFRPIYIGAANMFNVPWQLIEAVHEVESGKSGSTSRTSYAGAQGPMQFMPGTWRTYGVDGDGDGSVDAHNVVDAIYGAAHLLARSGADEGRIDDALFNYNHAQWYVIKVKTIAYEIGLPSNL